MFIYYILVSVVLVIAGPFLLLKKKSRSGLGQKFGIIPEQLKKQVEGQKKNQTSAACLKPSQSNEKSGESASSGIWLHAVSVGEFNAILPLVKRLSEEMPEVPLYLSTTTATGQALAQERVGSYASVFYFPLDLPLPISSWLDTLQPQLVAIAETEIWPGFAYECKKRGIKLITVNGRISPNSFKTYYSLRAFFTRVLGCYTAFGVQTESEAQRFRAISGENTSVCVLGNMKLDGLVPAPAPDIVALRNQIGLTDDDFVLVAGSTHEGEETAALNAFRRLCDEYRASSPPAKRPRLIIAPRHPERFNRAAEIITAANFSLRRNSAGQAFDQGTDRQESARSTNGSTASEEVYLLDSLGQLARFYGLASVAFVGGTIKNIGGHNVAEPYAYSVPVCCGPHIQKTYDVASALQAREAILIAGDTEELAGAILNLYRKPELAATLGKRGKDWIEENQGAVGRTLEFIRRTLDGTGASDKGATSDGVSAGITDGAPLRSQAFTNSGARGNHGQK